MKSEYNTLEFDYDKIRRIMQKQKEERIRKEQEEQETKNKNNQTKINNKNSKNNASLGDIVNLKQVCVDYISTPSKRDSVSTVQFTNNNLLLVAQNTNSMSYFENPGNNIFWNNSNIVWEHKISEFSYHPHETRIFANEKDHKQFVFLEISKINKRFIYRGLYYTFPGEANSVSYSPCGKFVAIADLKDRLKVYKTDDDLSVQKIVKKEHDNLLNQIAFSYDNKYLISGCDNGDLYVYRNELEKKNSLDLIMTMPFPKIIKGLSFTRDNKYFVTNQNYSDNKTKNKLTFYKYDFEKNFIQEAYSYPISKHEVNSISISPNDKYIALGTNAPKKPLKVFEIIRK